MVDSAGKVAKEKPILGRIRHCLSGKYLGTNSKFISNKSQMQEIFCAVECLKTPITDILWVLDVQESKEIRDQSIIRI